MAPRATPVHLRPDGTTTTTATARSLPSELLDLIRPPAWHADAACREHPELNWFPDVGQHVDAAKAVCRACLVREECAAFAAGENNRLSGIWGGLSARDRQQRRRRPAA